MTSKLLTLPTDILISIIVHLPTASCLTHLSQTCRSLHAFISAEGWRVFVQCRHAGFHAKVTRALPHGKSALTWNRWAEELTVTRSNWDNFGFLASGLFVEGKWRSRRKKKEEEQRLGLRRRAQEEACVPVIDLWEEWAGGEEVLVIGAGTNMMVRKRRRHGRSDGWWRYERVIAGAGVGSGERDKDSDKSKGRGRGRGRDVDMDVDEGEEGAIGGEGGDGGEEEPTVFEIFNAKHRASYLRGCRDNPQDYTAVHLLGSGGLDNAEIAVVGRASGALEMVKLTTGPGRAGRVSVLGRFETPVRKSQWGPRIGKYTSILPHVGSGNQCGLMSAGVRTGLTSRFALYRVHIPSDDDFQVTPQAPVSEVEMSAGDGDIWSTNLLSPEFLAVTKTNSHKSPLCVYAVTPDGVRKTPMRSFPDPLGLRASTDATATARLESFAGEFPSGRVFLSAWSGGDLSMHDLRSPKEAVARWGSFISKPIRSLHTLNSGKFLVGHSEACMLRVFDIRSKYGDLDECIPTEGKWSKYPYSWVTNFQLPGRSRPEPMDPVLALAVSPWAEKSVYAATPGMVWELNFAGTMTRAPERVPVVPGMPAWKRMWKRSRVWRKADEEKEMVEPVTLAVKAYNGLLWGMYHQRPPRRVYQRYV